MRYALRKSVVRVPRTVCLLFIQQSAGAVLIFPQNFTRVGDELSTFLDELMRPVIVFGGDVAGNFSETYYDSIPNGKYMLDLASSNRLMLQGEGVPEENISLSGICTKCSNDLFFSHRGQNGKSGTLGGIICIKD